MKRKITLASSGEKYEVEDEYFITAETGIPFYIFTTIIEGKRMTLTVPVANVASQLVPENENFIESLRVSSEYHMAEAMERVNATRAEKINKTTYNGSDYM